MRSLFETSERLEILDRLSVLGAGSARQWGKMDPAQMLCHCSNALESATGDRPKNQSFLGRILTPFIRSSILSEKPFGRNAPTDPTYRVSDPHEFEAERDRLVGLIDRFVEAGADAAGRQIHPFFGKLTGDEWGQLLYKHLDHHLRQFGV